MTARIYPVDAVGGLPTNPGRALRQTAVAPFVALGSTARPLGALSGVRPGTPSTIGSVTSTTWTVAPFAGVLDGEALAIAGPYTYAFDTAQTGAVNPAGASARTDRLDVQINDSAESDGTPTTTPAFPQIVYTPGSSITPPAAPARSHPLFLINAPAAGGGSPTLTWNASFAAAAGGFADFLTLAALRLWTTAPAGQHATVTADPTTANNGDYVWNVAANRWDATYSGAPTSASLSALGGYAVGIGSTTRRGSLVLMNQQFTCAAGMHIGDSIGTLPSGFRPAQLVVLNGASSSGGTQGAMSFQINTAGNISINSITSTPTAAWVAGIFEAAV